jgi:ribulose-phosphate 3-epimerase
MKVSTSILNSNNRIDDVLKLNRTNTSYIHIDVMDGEFVDDIQFKINEIKAVNRVTRHPMDVHLMANDPIKYIMELGDMNIDYITFHLEIRRNKEKIISKIKEMGYKVGISINPNTDIEKIEPYLKDIDLVLIMSVEPGRGGQEFLDSTIDKINKLRKMIDDNKYNCLIEVDGGINDKTISLVNNVDIAVVGSYIIKSDNYYLSIEKLLKLASKGNKSISGNDNVNCINKKILIYKILLGIGLTPFILLLLGGIFSSIFGFTFFFSTGYGFEAFFAFVSIIGWLCWPILLIGLILSIFSGIKLKKYKK